MAPPDRLSRRARTAQRRRCGLSHEIELKLVLSADAGEAFTGSGLIAVAPITQKLHAIYFDTPDRTLLGAGMSLRIRRKGRKRIQTVKGRSTPGAGLFARSEWEMPVADDHPVLDDRTPIAALLGAAVDTLAPVFEIKVERMMWLLEGEPSIELVLDRGAAIAADRRSPVCEIELELKHGAQNALFALARKIAEVVPVRLGVVTKAERGYDLLGPRRDAFRAEAVHLDVEASSAQAFQAIAGLCIRHYRLNETLLLDARAPEALHQARVSLRRLRSAIAIFKPLLVGEAVSHLQSELRWLTGLLGEARDLDVLLAKVGPGALHDRLAAAREDAYAHLATALDSRRARALMLDLAEWLATGPWLRDPEQQEARDLPIRAFAAEALDQLRRRVKKRGAAFAQLSSEDRHDVRKAAKRLRYGAEFFATLFASETRARRYRQFAAALEELQDELGTLNDLAAAPLMLKRLGLLDQPGVAPVLAHRKPSRIIAAAEVAFGDLLDRKPFWS